MVVAPNPNPSSGIFNFYWQGDKVSTNQTLHIHSSTGAIIQRTAFTGRYTWTPLSNLSSGLYYYVLTDENGKAIQQGKLIYNRK